MLCLKKSESLLDHDRSRVKCHESFTSLPTRWNDLVEHRLTCENPARKEQFITPHRFGDAETRSLVYLRLTKTLNDIGCELLRNTLGDFPQSAIGDRN